MRVFSVAVQLAYVAIVVASIFSAVGYWSLLVGLTFPLAGAFITYLTERGKSPSVAFLFRGRLLGLVLTGVLLSILLALVAANKMTTVVAGFCAGLSFVLFQIGSVFATFCWLKVYPPNRLNTLVHVPYKTLLNRAIEYVLIGGNPPKINPVQTPGGAKPKRSSRNYFFYSSLAMFFLTGVMTGLAFILLDVGAPPFWAAMFVAMAGFSAVSAVFCTVRAVLVACDKRNHEVSQTYRRSPAVTREMQEIKLPVSRRPQPAQYDSRPVPRSGFVETPHTSVPSVTNPNPATRTEAVLKQSAGSNSVVPEGNPIDITLGSLMASR